VSILFSVQTVEKAANAQEAVKMKTRDITRNHFVKNLFAVALGILLITGCSGTYAHLQRSGSVADLFHQNIVLPDYRYYYTGPDAAPDAILGIHKSFTLESRIWKAIDLDEKQLNNWIGWLNPFRLPSRSGPYGYAIRDDAGKQIGVWYSKHRQIAVELFEDGRITVSLPRDMDIELRLMSRIE
jgi:hypothetical protein